LFFFKGNIALFKTTVQSSTLGLKNKVAKSSNAVDGGVNTEWTHCVHTSPKMDTDPWWRVDLGRVEHVAEVYILNRNCGTCGTALDGAEIRVGEWKFFLYFGDINFA